MSSRGGGAGQRRHSEAMFARVSRSDVGADGRRMRTCFFYTILVTRIWANRLMPCFVSTGVESRHPGGALAASDNVAMAAIRTWFLCITGCHQDVRFCGRRAIERLLAMFAIATASIRRGTGHRTLACRRCLSRRRIDLCSSPLAPTSGTTPSSTTGSGYSITSAGPPSALYGRLRRDLASP